MNAICDIALFAVTIESLMPISALARRDCIPCVVALSVCAMVCAALTALIRADCESGLVDRP
jgi:hypothetical protein